LLQLSNLRADCRLRTKNLFPGAGKTALPGNFQERDELIKVHCGGGEIIANSPPFAMNYPQSMGSEDTLKFA
jgi:hypothetical protein